MLPATAERESLQDWRRMGLKGQVAVLRDESRSLRLTSLPQGLRVLTLRIAQLLGAKPVGVGSVATQDALRGRAGGKIDAHVTTTTSTSPMYRTSHSLLRMKDKGD